MAEDPHPVDALNVRDYDAETAHPRLPDAEGKTKKPAIINPPKNLNKDVTPSKPKDSAPSAMLAIFSRLKLTPVIFNDPASFVPCALMMYDILHRMDTAVANNTYLLRATKLYHPLFTRLYFGILFLVQCLRCMDRAKTISRRQKAFLRRFLSHYPAHTLPIPGPLIPLFKSLTCSDTLSSVFTMVTPWIPEEIGNENRNDLLCADETHSLFLPQIPLILSLTNQLIATQGDEPFANNWNPMPNLPAPQAQPVNVFGRQFAHDTPENVRWGLLSPGIAHPLEVSGAVSSSFRNAALFAEIPPVLVNTDCRDISAFCGMDASDNWFANVVSAINSYDQFFNAPGTLADCSPHGFSTSLVETEALHPANNPPVPNGVFPIASILKYDTRHISREHPIEPGCAKLAMLSKLQTQFSPDYPAPYAGAGSLATGDRFGAYYLQPTASRTTLDTTSRIISQSIAPFVRQRPR